ncbi:MAG: hypothetical protein AUK47_13645 [Deltaproteobacteria bacterium CG2_30_63_29]|nr:MAG: hypothetical protein AUK47_13645 [Deltaproteobacteria bacterium CG2_30_63_29]
MLVAKLVFALDAHLNQRYPPRQSQTTPEDPMQIALAIFLLGLTAAQTPPEIDATALLSQGPEQADVFVYFNVDAVAEPGWNWLTEDLAGQPFLKTSPELENKVKEGLEQMKEGLQTLTTMSGIDPLKDVHYGAVWFKVNDLDKEDFELLVVVDGNFADGFLDTAAPKLDLKESKVVGNKTLYMGDKKKGAAMQVGNQIVMGTTDWIETRAKGEYKAPKIKKGSQLGRIKAKLDNKPILVFDVELGGAITKGMEAKVDSKSAYDILAGFESFDLTLYADGIDFDIVARSKDMQRRYALMFEGLVDMLRASQSATQGLSKAVIGIISDDDPAIDTDARAFLKEKDSVLAFVLKHTGDGLFKLNNNSSEKDKTVALQLRAGHLREILSPALPMLIAGLAF